MPFNGHGPGCACCKGPAAWSALLPSLNPLAPATSVDSLVVTATNQPQVVKTSFVRDWFRIPNWALPTRALPEVSDDDDSLIALDAILAGRTKSPIRVDDLKAFLRNDERTNVISSRGLEFLLTYNRYRAAFFALPQEKQAPHPDTALQGLSLANRAIEIQSQFRTPRPTRSLYVKPSFIIGEINHPPSALDPVASRIHSHLTVDVLPRFLDDARQQIVLEVFLILYRTGRAARLLALPLWILAIGYAIGSHTGLCFWLAWRGTREHKSHELVEPMLSASPNNRAFGTSSTALVSEPQRPAPLLFRFDFLKRARKTNSSDNLSRSDNIAEKGQLPSDINLGVSVDKGRWREESQRDTFNNYVLSSTESRNSSAPLVDRKHGFVKRLMRLTGTAVDTTAVEDSGVRKLQARVGVRVAIWLFLGTSVVTGVIMAIP
ncbi:hypothetical protein RHS01_05719 [Rhizoctonia solani]|uniref:RGS domain-containing protein n=1 Tax=Rhizoctonia solani TaxID=456999 RepID=A0A8H7M4R2_9AGAM|nr:hypothetical protein RHS01_05719 [Rhizoctonia solani]